MPNARRLACAIICLLAVALASPIAAQSSPATLVGRALWPAGTLADGPKSGLALSSQKVINNIKVPFDSQPVGNINAILPTAYADIWLALTGGTYDSRQNSGDLLLRIYTLQVNFRRATSGDGTVSILDWQTLSDPQKKAKDIKNATTRDLTGQDFNPRALYRAKDGTLWIAEAYGPSLLHFDGNGRLLEAPFAMGGAGALQGMTGRFNGQDLLVAQRTTNNAGIVFRIFNSKGRTFRDEVLTYNLDNASNSVGGLLVTKGRQVLVIEQDSAQNKEARFKRIFLADFSVKPAKKTLIVDLLNIADPRNISTAVNQPANAFGVGSPFLFPYLDVSTVYPADAKTLIVVNNNHVPFGKGRSTTEADATDYIAIQLAQPLDLDLALRTAR
jgi:hypothetical protein